MISISHWGMFDGGWYEKVDRERNRLKIGNVSGWTFEGPAYAGRVGGRLTFLDWEHWTEADQDEYAAEFMERAPARVKLAFMIKHGLIDERFSEKPDCQLVPNPMIGWGVMRKPTDLSSIWPDDYGPNSEYNFD